MKLLSHCLLLLLFATVIGCDEEKEDPIKKRLRLQDEARIPKPAGDPSTSYAPLPPPEVEAGQPVLVEGTAQAAAAGAVTAPDNNSPANAEAANTVQGVKIFSAEEINPDWAKPPQQGLGKQGRDYGPGYIAETMTAYWRLRERAGFDIPFQSGMNTFKALNDNKPPKDVATLKKEILDPAGLALPDLAAGQIYMYDPHTGELMVMQKKSAN